LRCEGINLFLADGSAAGQTIFHPHLHVIPRYVGDGFS
jgi:histidine triad (HIT) family protein